MGKVSKGAHQKQGLSSLKGAPTVLFDGCKYSYLRRPFRGAAKLLGREMERSP